MPTKSAENNVRKAIKARLKLNDKQANDLIVANWGVFMPDQMDGCVALVEPATDGRRGTHELRFQLRNTYGYYETVMTFELEKQHLARWEMLSLEEAYELPEGYVSRPSAFAWANAEIISVAANSEGTLDIVADIEDHGHTELRTMDAGEEDGLYVEQIGKMVEIYVDMNPPANSQHARLLTLTGQTVKPLIFAIRADNEEFGGFVWGEPFSSKSEIVEAVAETLDLPVITLPVREG